MLKNIFSFKGRINRKQFLIRLAILYAVFQVILFVSFAALEGSAGEPTGASALLGVDTILNLILSIMALSILVRRFHDMGRTGWLVIPMVPLTPVLFAPFTLIMGFLMFTGAWLPLVTVGFVGLYSFIAFLALILIPGSKGPNKYGESPQGNKAVEQPAPETT